ncbi:hypothetical protein Tco_0954450 [Tanacetum coccineum]|uniref:Uncharacterized protein n=1 Tax=Tanacetum coccineum TaxID=301880 RepID=A0ABQ5E2Q4_9ASTR
MSSITAQQTKLDLELVPKENRLDIRKCNGRIPRGLTPRKPTFQVVLDAIALTPCYHAFLICINSGILCRDFDALSPEEDTVSFLRELDHTGEINSLNDVVVDQLHQPWRTFDALINWSLSGTTSGLEKLRLSRAQILWESTQIYGAILPECLTSPAMKESKAYKTYLGYATESQRVKRPGKKSTNKPTAGVVIREALVETKSKSKEKEMVEVTRGKGIELLFAVALTEEAQMKEVRKKSLRYFHKTHPSGSGTVVVKPPSVDKITPTVTSEGTGDKSGVPDVTEDDSTESESESWGNDEDDSNNDDQDSSNEDSEQENESEEQVSDSEQEEESEDDDQEEEEFVHTPSPTDDKDDENLESESDEVIKSDEEKGLDDTTYQFDDDVDARLKESTQTDKEVIQGEGADAEMHDAQQGNENLETTQE